MRIPVRASLTVFSAALLLGTGCSDDAEPQSSTSTTTSEPTDDTVSLGDGEVAALSDQEICDGLTAVDVGSALGLEISEVAVGGSSTAQCAYDYQSGSGGTSNLTVASLASGVDLGGRGGDDAFDFVLEINRGVAGGTDFEEAEVEAGDRAVRISGTSLHLGILAVDGHLFTVLVPADDVDGAAVDDLLSTMADRFGG